MPYKSFRRTFRRARRGLRRFVGRARRTYRARNYRRTSRIAKTVPIELHYFDQPYDAPFTANPGTDVPSLTSTDLIRPVAMPPQGTAKNNRQGSLINLNYITIRGLVKSVDNSTASTYFRMALVLDRKPTSTVPNVTDIFSPITGTTPTSFALEKVDNAHRFKILKHWVWSFNAISAGAGLQSVTVPIDMSVSLAGLSTRFLVNSTGGDLASINENALYFVFLSDQLQAQSVQVNLQTRLRFYD